MGGARVDIDHTASSPALTRALVNEWYPEGNFAGLRPIDRQSKPDWWEKPSNRMDVVPLRNEAHPSSNRRYAATRTTVPPSMTLAGLVDGHPRLTTEAATPVSTFHSQP
ncbi:hypothetical protein R1flu_016597 [Riccia fluitans]|uniref:Uncharacterized protein n=1 Tax=Riccia fluitans TaxID=41844 RepID=A0ABD1YMT9_9MARC